MDKIVFAKVKDNAQIPARDSWNAGFDIYPCFEEESFIIEPHTTALVPTGIASAVPENYYIQIQERGSTGSRVLNIVPVLLIQATEVNGS